ncbi:MAG: DNA polymerase III subunit beta [Leptolyngbyaceae cyanobacterium bins.59]|nr:DNA polymerase III subunit beta [Leptolyngbyaceae cyanobacterium bins.59]
MKLICNQSDFNTHLSLVSRAVPSRPTLPVLANILLEANEETQRVYLVAFDLNLSIRTGFDAQVEVGGKLTLPAKLLTDIVSRLPDGEVVLEEQEDESAPFVILTSASGQYQMRGIAATEFPELPIVENGQLIHLPVEALLEGFQGSLFATSSDESKQVLTGVHLTMQPETLEFAATDGHRLAVVETAKQESEETPVKGKAAPDSEFDVTVPAKTLRELERMLGMRQLVPMVTVNFNPTQAVFEWGDQRLTSRLLEGQYPNYRQLIPKQFARQMTVERRLFLSALERISVLADQRNNVVKLSIDAKAQQVTLSVDAQDVGSGKESVSAQISGDSIDVAFNVKYLLDGLKVFTTSEVQVQMNTATSPVVITPLGSVKMTYLVMPVQVRS